MQVVIFPPNGYEGEKFWAVCENNWHIVHCELLRQLEEAGFSSRVYPCELDKDKDFGIYFEHQNPIPLTHKSLCIFLEPPVVQPRQYASITGLPYTRILTYCRPYCDEKLIHFSPFPVPSYDKPITTPWKDRTKYICAISANKSSNQPGELYTARRLAYLSWGKDLDLYGHGWHSDVEIVNTCNYLGIVQDKIQTLAQYKHAIVFENQVIDGWNSEKYYHSLQAGTPPLYRGSKKNILPLAEVTEIPWANRIVKHVMEIVK